MISQADILNANILIVDDQAANVALLEGVLGNAGYTQVSATTDPAAVCAMHREHAYDLILLDLQMPGIDGFQVIEVLKANEDDAFLPVLVLTAQPGHKLRALQAGVRDFISKPFDLVEVKIRIRNMLEVRLLYKQLDQYNSTLEKAVRQRTMELHESEARYRGLAELACDWYWEQDITGTLTRVSGPVLEMLGIRVNGFVDDSLRADPIEDAAAGWNEAERDTLRAKIAAREPFLDFLFTRVDARGAKQHFQVSGQPMFDGSSRFIGYRGIGLELTGLR